MRALRNLCSAAALQRRRIRRRPAVDNISQIDPPATVPMMCPRLYCIRRAMMNRDLMQGKRLLDWGCISNLRHRTSLTREITPECKESVKFALEEHNQKMCGKQQLELVEIICAHSKLVSGFIYTFSIKAKDKVDGNLKIFNGKVHAKINGFTTEGFHMVDDLGPSHSPGCKESEGL